jgi:hypothetical protein
MKKFWNEVEEFLTHIPKIVLCIIAIIGMCIPNTDIGLCLCLIALVLSFYRED